MGFFNSANFFIFPKMLVKHLHLDLFKQRMQKTFKQSYGDKKGIGIIASYVM